MKTKSLKWRVSKEDSALTLQEFLKAKLTSYSAKQIKKLLDHHCCFINNNVERFGKAFVGAGDEIQLTLDESLFSSKLLFEKSRILFEDSHILAYDKPAWISCDKEGIEALVRSYCKTATHVHRLDKETTGVLLIAKTKEAYEGLFELFKGRAIQKTYLALVDGNPSKNQGIIQNHLGKLQDLQGQSLWGVVKNGLTAITEWKVVKRGKKCALLECHPKTGRTHQIRVHCSGMGHPILGDWQYGKSFQCTYQPARILLHASELFFPHPITEQALLLKAGLPQDFLVSVDVLFKK